MALRRVSVVGFAGVLALTGSIPALADNGTAKAGTSDEAWYSTTDACKEDVDCSLLPPPAAYPEHTLHVGITGGRSTAETYLELETSDVPDGQGITGGTLRLPVNNAPSDGSLRPMEARLIVCLVTGSIDRSDGSFSETPERDCDAASSPATFNPTPEPVFAVDLAPFATAWAEGAIPRLAVLPAPEAHEASDTWHVTFWGRKHKDGTPITAEMQYGRTAGNSGLGQDEGAVDFGGGEVEFPSASPPAVDPTGPALGVAPEAAELPVTEEPAPDDGKAPAVAPQPMATAPEFRTVGYAYPISWLMPLLMLTGFGLTGRALTKRLDLAP